MSSNIDYKTVAIAIFFSVILSTGIIMTVPQVQDALRGPQGESGPQGEQGPQGVPGVPYWSDNEVENVTANHVNNGVTANVSNGGSDSIFSASDYFPTEPGRYIKFYVSDTNSEDCEFEMAFQKSGNRGFLTTLTQTNNGGGRWSFNAIYWRESNGVLCYGSGCPGSNRGNIFRNYFSIPVTFKDGDTWDTWSIPLVTVNLLDNRTVSRTYFEDCVKISFQSGDGEGEFYLARGLGIIEIIFRRWDETIFTARAIEWGKSNPITISGRLTLDGTRPAEGYGVCLSNCGELGVDIAIVDEYGRFALEVFGHSILIRYGPIREDGWIYQSTKIEQKFDDVTGDITDLELSMGIPP